ncbi:orotate phosphoribosyltransferase [Agrobacterium vitis]|uniref:Orotate phosphoribosyltransferase n=2 Tax=Rhizobium/Agrobacterium group TaxID=227290 RepID=PYRE_ALLAM|nr:MULTISPECIES: orotate phosphoribosyltransferase [Rhizobium/Agrobacterium group]B9JQW1.1 RecName: Full=Orotate phosphoribosyltransferase; Short=OPRT; Short=OPRTase [Allorhizobium ampelinum S4]ACM35374.1 orotate phosphoribosyltransferase [Allorhizobium ampelinum S4]MBF2717283.1 orotate phosphoribosyltransferase [Agrobacterium vitis]MCF1447067.1 orotate phosphoribosyltransferase [Allorhizobium ampelinum]MCF1462125.1 orotate phosphoribosyltransferase [Allorhizobium ampelinum]MUO28162.1 orotate
MTQTSFSDPAVMAELLAKMLWEIKAVHFNAAEPYKLASGMRSPVYIDCRKLLSYPRVRSAVMDFAVATLLRNAGFEQFDCIAGGETAGIPFAALLADRLALPMIYVRKQPKGHGRNAQIEGHMPDGARVLVIEDLTTAGGSMFTFIDAVRAAGGVVDHGIALFFYGIFPQAHQRFENGNVKLHYIATWRNVLAVARDQKLFDDKTLSEVESFLDAPLEWSGRNGGVSTLG